MQQFLINEFGQKVDLLNRREQFTSESAPYLRTAL